MQQLHGHGTGLWNARDTAGAVAAFEEQLTIDKRSPLALTARKRLCVAYFHLQQPGRAVAACTLALDGLDPKETPEESGIMELLLCRAGSQLMTRDFDAALRDVNRAADIAPEDPKVNRLKAQIEDAAKNAGKKEYYKILGVDRQATSREIRSAYRKLAKQWHPDKNDDPAAETIFMDIAEAYEVLMDEELRQAHDRGEDVSKTAKSRRDKAFNFKFHYNPEDVKDEKVKAWFVDPETGEKDWVELNVKSQTAGGDDEPPMHMPRHCCIGVVGAGHF